MTLTVGSLFSGIEGLGLGLERAGMRVVWQSEIDPYCCRVLARHWPHVPNLGDVTLIDWSEVPRVDVICGGYPCQPFSQAGRQLGDKDPRHLWPWMLDAIRVLRPRYALLENVAGHLALGFGRILGDLAEIGYDTEWDCIPAAAVGAPHRRDRVFVVAYPQRDELRHQPGRGNGESRPGPAVASDNGTSRDVANSEELAERTGLRTDEPRKIWWRRPGDSGGPQHVAHTEGQRCPPLRSSGARQAGADHLFGHAGQLPGADSWAAEPDVGRVAHGVPARLDRLRALGNAVVPQVAEHIGRLIVEAA